MFFDEFADSLFPDKLQVVHHAHSVVFSVSVVNAIDLFAGILIAFKTKGGIAFCSVVDPRAFFEQISASLVSRPAADASASP